MTTTPTFCCPPTLETNNVYAKLARCCYVSWSVMSAITESLPVICSLQVRTWLDGCQPKRFPITLSICTQPVLLKNSFCLCRFCYSLTRHSSTKNKPKKLKLRSILQSQIKQINTTVAYDRSKLEGLYNTYIYARSCAPSLFATP